MRSDETRRIIRQWHREIADDRRREETPRHQDGRWKYLIWTALWLLWLAVLVGLVGLIRPLRW